MKSCETPGTLVYDNTSEISRESGNKVREKRMPEEGKYLDGLLSGTLDLTLHKWVGINKPRLKPMPLLAHPHLDSRF